jgi:Predicted membrane protein (DUF2306)
MAAKSRGSALPAVLWTLAVLTSVYVWARIALPLLAGAKAGAHEGHHGVVYAHAVGGTLMLVAGSAAIFIGWTRRWFFLHRALGAVYLLGGGAGAAVALYLSIVPPHEPKAIGVATGVLAAVWLLAAAMAFRAILNRRIEQHREWMTRSYVLTWTFVFCRMVMQAPMFATASGDMIAAVIWTTWIVPLMVCEAALQWGRGAKAA